MNKTALVIPCYNETARLQIFDFVKSVAEHPQLHIIFVNDGSTDGTQVLLDTACQMNATQMVNIVLPTNSGKAEAVRQGFLRAFEEDFQIIGYWDADLSTPLSAVPQFCQALESSDGIMVMGARVRLLGRKIERKPLRHYLGRLFATCASLVLDVPVYDTQCGAKIFRNCDELKLVFSMPFFAKWLFDVEILARLIMIEKHLTPNLITGAITEYPLEEWKEISGSKLKATDFFLAPASLFKILLFLRAPQARKRFNVFLSYRPNLPSRTLPNATHPFSSEFPTTCRLREEKAKPRHLTLS